MYARTHTYIYKTYQDGLVGSKIIETSVGYVLNILSRPGKDVLSLMSTYIQAKKIKERQTFAWSQTQV